MRPVIGITCSFESTKAQPPVQRLFLHAAYADAIYDAGGLAQPIALPPEPEPKLLDELLRRCDGVVFTGGADINPSHYRQPKHAKTELMHDRREAFELEFFQRADAAGLPILAICLGCQVVNVGRGGTLIQHLDDWPREKPLAHKNDTGTARHPVKVEPGSRLARVVGSTEFAVNSRHHQAIDPQRLGDRLRLVATAPDGVVEAVEDSGDRFFLAIQWHAEDMTGQPEHRRLFEAVVHEAAAWRSRK